MNMFIIFTLFSLGLGIALGYTMGWQDYARHRLNKKTTINQ